MRASGLSLVGHFVLILLLTLLGWHSARVLTLLLQPSPSLTPREIIPSNVAQPFIDLDAALWPQPSTKIPRVLKGKQTDAKALGISLLGVIALSNGQGVVVVQTSIGRKVVRQGEVVVDGLILTQVWPDRVVLQRDNGSVLWIPLQKQSAGASAGASTHAGATVLNNLLMGVRRNPAALFQYVQLRPGGHNGTEWVTVQARAGQEHILKALGLQTDDRIEAINGKPLVQVIRQPALWQALMNANRWQLTVRRHGKPEEIIINAAP